MLDFINALFPRCPCFYSSDLVNVSILFADIDMMLFDEWGTNYCEAAQRITQRIQKVVKAYNNAMIKELALDDKGNVQALIASLCTNSQSYCTGIQVALSLSCSELHRSKPPKRSQAFLRASAALFWRMLLTIEQTLAYQRGYAAAEPLATSI